ncbi:hypothetical protein [Curtobacterium sp. MCBD17_040]|uniref:hypothetical protein n=1 Tax=Curtobacterium sp. MCBD17_040 TaxID=2175674 RepID=UPI000DA950A0|nr:hypothetical protein [Curtobacterium sp. MCBD17_040]WIB65449.1 hypothetical protein DEI94_18885 [Curtobacterium sp. MCBD17_040]
MTKSETVAEYLLLRDPTLRRQPKKLTALVYLSQAHHLAVTGTPLFPEAVIAAAGGPVPNGLIRVRRLMRPWSAGSQSPRLRSPAHAPIAQW